MKDSPWRPGIPRPPKPAKTPLSQAQIVQAALRIVRTDGIDGVSMRRLAAEFGTGPSSLYAHVASKDELLQLMFDEVCALVPVPPLEPERWQEQILELARAGHDALLAHYDLARSALASIPSGPHAMRISDAMLGMMLAGGVPPRIAAWAMDRIFLYITADAYEMSIWRTEVTEAGRATDEFIDQMSEDLLAYFGQLSPEQYPNLHKYAKEMVDGRAAERFELGLDLLVYGLDKYVTRAG